MTTMALGTISICMTVVVLNIHHRAPRVPVPPWLKSTMLYYMARMMCMRTHYISVINKRDRIYKVKIDQNSSTSKTEYNKNGLLDEMESMGLTAVLNNRYPEITRCNNGPMATMGNNHNHNHNHIPDSPSVCSNLSHASTTSGLKKRHRKLSRSKRSRVFSSQDEEDDEMDFSRDWHEFAQVLDRVFFWVLLFLMTTSALVILLYPKYTGIEKKAMHME